MKFGDFCSLVRQTFHQGKSNDRNLSSDENQETWVMKAKVESDNVYIFEHVDNILRQYQKICDNPLQRYILHEYLAEVKEKDREILRAATQGIIKRIWWCSVGCRVMNISGNYTQQH